MARRASSVGNGGNKARLGVLCLALAILAGLAWWRNEARKGARAPGPSREANSAVDAEVARDFLAIEEKERELDRTVWAAERTAQARGAIIEELWDALRASKDPLGDLRDVSLGDFSVVPAGRVVALPLGIRQFLGGEGLDIGVPGPREKWADWRQRVDRWRSEGWRLDQSEWRHVRYQPATNGIPSSSWFAVSLDLSRSQPVERAEIDARVRISWNDAPPTVGESGAATGVMIRDVVVESYDLRRRAGEPLFREVHARDVAPFARTSWIDPILVRDSRTGPGPEFILAARNLVLRRETDGSWTEAPLMPQHPGLVFTALLADFTGDGVDDLLWAVRGGLVLSRANSKGDFESAAESAWAAPSRLEYAQAPTCGDIDGDGDLDVFIGQYRPPYVGGQMPRPYFDARDGPPAFLLRNEGQGRFVDVTAESGLAATGYRRTYGASFVDVDGDGDLDLVVTSDFAGVDLYLNDGRGRFVDATRTQLGPARGFGMSHAFGDFDADGRLDLLMVAMPQPTADRLDGLGLERPGFESWREERPRLVYGNRMFFGRDLGRPDGERPRVDGLARCGWAWSAAVLDFDRDRLPDLHVVNGHESRASVRDYENEFWTHDIYVGDSKRSPAADAYFASKFAVTRSRGWSYGGHDRNRFLWNRGGGGAFVSLGHLLGLSAQEDSRNAVAEDIDGDGDEDLLVTSFEIWPEVRQRVRIYENRVGDAGGRWIGIRLGGGARAMGARVTVRDRRGVQLKTWVSGEGYRAQGRPVLRFGLGDVERVDEVVVQWGGGRTTRREGLEAGREHAMTPP